MSPASAIARIALAFQAGIPGDREGPGRTRVEIAEATGLPIEAVFDALARMQRRGWVGGAVAETRGNSLTLFWPAIPKPQGEQTT